MNFGKQEIRIENYIATHKRNRKSDFENQITVQVFWVIFVSNVLFTLNCASALHFHTVPKTTTVQRSYLNLQPPTFTSVL